MAISYVSASPSGYAGLISAYGNTGWHTDGSGVGVTVPVGNGSAWAFWQLTVTGLPPGQPINTITLSGPISYTASGGVGTATAYVEMFKNYMDFRYAGSSYAMATIPGNGSSVPLSYNFTKPGFTSSDLESGNVFLGVAISTKNVLARADTPSTFYFGATGWTIYTNPNIPSPPAGSIVTQITNPAANINPGVYPGSAFAQITVQLKAPLPQDLYRTHFTLPLNYSSSGLTLAVPGVGTSALTTRIDRCGTNERPADPYRGYSGAINVAANAKPGMRTVRLDVSWVDIGLTDDTQATSVQVYVRPRGGGSVFTEA